MENVKNENSGVLKQDILDKISVLKTSNGKISYLEEQLNQEDELPKSTINATNALLGDLYFQEGSFCYALRNYRRANLVGREQIQAFTQLAEKYGATYLDDNGRQDLFEQVKEGYQRIGNDDKAREIGREIVDRKVQSNQFEYYASRIDEYGREGLSYEEAEERFLQKAQEWMQTKSNNKDSHILEYIHSLQLFSKTLNALNQDTLSREYTELCVREFISQKDEYDGRYMALNYLRGGKFIDNLPEGSKEKLSLKVLEYLIKNDNAFAPGFFENISGKISESACTNGLEKLTKSYLNNGWFKCAFEALEQGGLENKILWGQVANQAEAHEDFEMAALSYERTDAKEKTSTNWIRYGNSIVLEDQEIASQAYNKAGLDDVQINRKIGYSLFNTDSITQMTKSPEYLRGAGLENGEIKDNALKLKTKMRTRGEVKEVANLYEAFDLKEEANDIYMKIIQESCPNNCGLEEDLEKLGISKRSQWITMGESALNAKTRKKDYLASKVFEKAGYQTGSVPEMETLADIYERNSQGTKALELREKIILGK